MLMDLMAVCQSCRPPEPRAPDNETANMPVAWMMPTRKASWGSGGCTGRTSISRHACGTNNTTVNRLFLLDPMPAQGADSVEHSLE